MTSTEPGPHDLTAHDGYVHAVGTGPALGPAPYQIPAGVRVPAGVEQRVRWIAERFFELTGKPISVSSGTRTERQQGAAMLGVYRAAKGDGAAALRALYANDAAADEVSVVIAEQLAAAASKEQIEDALELVIKDQRSRNVVLSKHMLESAVDLSAAGLREPELQLLALIAAQIPGARAEIERAPLHLHLDFDLSRALEIGGLLEVGFYFGVHDLIARDPYLALRDRARELSRGGWPVHVRASVRSPDGTSYTNEQMFVDGALIHDIVYQATIDRQARFGALAGAPGQQRLRADLDSQLEAARSASDAVREQRRQVDEARERARAADEARALARQAHLDAMIAAREARERADEQRREAAERARQEAADRSANADRQRERAERDREAAEQREREAKERERRIQLQLGLGCVSPYAEPDDVLAVYMQMLAELGRADRPPLLQWDDGREPFGKEALLAQARALLERGEEDAVPKPGAADTNEEYLRQLEEYLRRNGRVSERYEDFRPSCGTPPAMHELVTRLFDRPPR